MIRDDALRVIASLRELSKAAQREGMPALWFEAQNAACVLAEALAFDEEALDARG